MNRVPIEKRARIIGLLVQGTSIRGVSRLVGCSTGTVRKLQVDLGFACSLYLNEVMRDLSCQRLRCDDVWAFRGGDEYRTLSDRPGERDGGDVYAWTAIDSDTALIPSFRIGGRSADSAYAFICDLASRMAGHVQLVSDGRRACLHAVDEAPDGAIDYAILEMLYDPTAPDGAHPDGSAGPGRAGNGATPDGAAAHDGNGGNDGNGGSVAAHHVPTLRMLQRGFLRPTNDFDRKMEALEHAVALQTMHHNFAHMNAVLRETPAMAAGVDDHVWTLQEIALLAD